MQNERSWSHRRQEISFLMQMHVIAAVYEHACTKDTTVEWLTYGGSCCDYPLGIAMFMNEAWKLSKVKNEQSLRLEMTIANLHLLALIRQH